MSHCYLVMFRLGGNVLYQMDHGQFTAPPPAAAAVALLSAMRLSTLRILASLSVSSLPPQIGCRNPTVNSAHSRPPPQAGHHRQAITEIQEIAYATKRLGEVKSMEGCQEKSRYRLYHVQAIWQMIVSGLIKACLPLYTSACIQ
jgi:hypothetical protein